MSIDILLESRSNGSCELCGEADSQLHAYTVPPKAGDQPEGWVVLCTNCLERITKDDYSEANYWRFLEGSIWSEVPAIQALSYRLLGKLPGEQWAADAMASVVLDESVMAWAQAEARLAAEQITHKDAYGVVLSAGDTVILTENLNVKGTSFSAPKGTVVRKVRLVPDNEAQIEGKINGMLIVILTKYVRKSA